MYTCVHLEVRLKTTNKLVLRVSSHAITLSSIKLSSSSQHNHFIGVNDITVFYDVVSIRILAVKFD